ncbi:hypothetical protein [Xanthomonas arboricola]|uniref:hypothetical protein n=1 Tax=Xanthomonas arboricola TaxID=56448 RepID=UPI0011B05DDF|nr:hypothetical protein [Xanthomonas arboricola]
MDKDFSYITLPELRESLASDYLEMQVAFKNRAWKAVQVLAGSIVEALLVDYLTWANSSTSTGKDPLKMDFKDLIDCCKKDGAIKMATADMCSAVKTYRNLIHPGRIIRMGEDQPNPSSANVAVSLVDIINNDIEGFRRKKVGFTAEQIYHKMASDKNVVHVLQHLVKELSEHEKLRLLTDVLPSNNLINNNYYRESNGEYEPIDTDRFRACYIETFRVSELETKIAALKYFHDLILHGVGEEVTLFRDTFFTSSLLDYAESNQREVVKSHLLGTAPTVHDDASSSILVGLAAYLVPADIEAWANPFLMASVYPRRVSNEEIKMRFMGELSLLEDECNKKLKATLKKWRNNVAGRKDQEAVLHEIDGIESWLDFLM